MRPDSAAPPAPSRTAMIGLHPGGRSAESNRARSAAWKPRWAERWEISSMSATSPIPHPSISTAVEPAGHRHGETGAGETTGSRQPGERDRTLEEGVPRRMTGRTSSLLEERLDLLLRHHDRGQFFRGQI